MRSRCPLALASREVDFSGQPPTFRRRQPGAARRLVVGRSIASRRGLSGVPRLFAICRQPLSSRHSSAILVIGQRHGPGLRWHNVAQPPALPPSAPAWLRVDDAISRAHVHHRPQLSPLSSAQTPCGRPSRESSWRAGVADRRRSCFPAMGGAVPWLRLPARARRAVGAASRGGAEEASRGVPGGLRSAPGRGRTPDRALRRRRHRRMAPRVRPREVQPLHRHARTPGFPPGGRVQRARLAASRRYPLSPICVIRVPADAAEQTRA